MCRGEIINSLQQVDISFIIASESSHCFYYTESILVRVSVQIDVAISFSSTVCSRFCSTGTGEGR